MANIKFTRSEIWTTASGSFLCEAPPVGFLEWNEEKQYEFCEDYAWEPIENWSGEDIFNVIDDHADSIIQMLQFKGIEVEINY